MPGLKSEHFTMNTSTALAGREWNGTLIRQRVSDGYANATAMCQANGKRLNDYMRLDRTGAYIDALAQETGIPAGCLVQLTRGGRPELQGTWVHPRLSVDLARWISPAFAVFMDGWFLDWIRGGSQAPEAQPQAALPTRQPASSYYRLRHWGRYQQDPCKRWGQTTDVGRLAMALACLVEDEQAGSNLFDHPVSSEDHRRVIADAAGEISRHYCGMVFGVVPPSAAPFVTSDALLNNARSLTTELRRSRRRQSIRTDSMN